MSPERNRTDGEAILLLQSTEFGYQTHSISSLVMASHSFAVEVEVQSTVCITWRPR